MSAPTKEALAAKSHMALVDELIALYFRLMEYKDHVKSLQAEIKRLRKAKVAT